MAHVRNVVLCYSRSSTAFDHVDGAKPIAVHTALSRWFTSAIFGPTWEQYIYIYIWIFNTGSSARLEVETFSNMLALVGFCCLWDGSDFGSGGDTVDRKLSMSNASYLVISPSLSILGCRWQCNTSVTLGLVMHIWSMYVCTYIKVIIMFWDRLIRTWPMQVVMYV